MNRYQRLIAKMEAGEKVLINGASGGVGTFAIQIAKALGAEVTAVCSTTKLETSRGLGADHVIDYTQEDFTHNGQLYDLIVAVNGDHPLSTYVDSLTPSGRYVVIGGSMKQLFQAMLLGSMKTRSTGKSVHTFTAQPSQKDLIFMNELVEDGKVKPLIDRSYPLEETPDAMRYLEAGHAKGKIIILPGGIE